MTMMLMTKTEDESKDKTFSDEFKVTYKTTNIYNLYKRPLYFISNVPHLLKTWCVNFM